MLIFAVFVFGFPFLCVAIRVFFRWFHDLVSVRARADAKQTTSMQGKERFAGQAACARRIR